jgi:hypothetical protein
MQIVAHRVNTLDKLWVVPKEHGIEFDVREGPNKRVVVTHDPWTPGIDFSDFLEECEACPHAFYIVNIKCEGIEDRVLAGLSYHNISSFFLLDCSFPSIVRLSQGGEKRIAVRLSEFESIETVLNMDEKVEWVWIDVFTRLPVSEADCQRLHEAGFKLCLVSPELQGRPSDIPYYKPIISHCIDMVCTKKPRAWRAYAAL